MSRSHGPETCPEGWIDLWMAVRDFGFASIGGLWLRVIGDPLDRIIAEGGYGSHLEFRNLGLKPDPRPGPYAWIPENHELQIPQDDNGLAKFFVRAVLQSFSSSVKSGRLRTSYREKGGGTLFPIPVDWWETDDIEHRFRGWGIDPENLFSNSCDDLPSWVFVNEDDFNAVCQELQTWRNELDQEPKFNDDGSIFEGGTINQLVGNGDSKFPIRCVGGVDYLVAYPPSLPRFTKFEVVDGEHEIETEREQAEDNDFTAWFEKLPSKLKNEASATMIEGWFKESFPHLELGRNQRDRLLAGRIDAQNLSQAARTKLMGIWAETKKS